MIKLFVELNPKAKCEKSIYNTLKKVFGGAYISRPEALTDFYMILDFTPENVEKATSIQDLEGIKDIEISAIDITLSNYVESSEESNEIIVFITTENGSRSQVMAELMKKNEDFSIRTAGYLFNGKVDLIASVVSIKDSTEVNKAIRCLEGVDDTIIYSLA